MKRLTLALAALVGLVGVSWGEDEVTVRSREKPVTGVIKSETPRGIVLEKTKGKETFGTEEILDIYYDLPGSPEVKFGAYSGARKEEKDSLDPAKEAKRKAHLLAAIAKYKEVVEKAKDKLPLRHMRYKIATLQLRLSLEEGDPIEPAIKLLEEFKTNFPASWQVVPVLQTLAQVRSGRGEFKEAAAAYEELAGLDLTPDAQVDAQIQAASVSIRAKKHDEAMKKLEALVSKLPKGSRQALRAQVAVGECLIAQGKADEAMVFLRGILKESTDKGVKAAAYNALGEGFMKKEQYKDARWEFLWVDVVYNQDPVEHARALYNLARTFDALGEADRALECREMLASDRQFAGLEHQRLAQNELAGEKKK